MGSSGRVNVNTKHLIAGCAAVLLSVAFTASAQEKGKIKICRLALPGSDRGAVFIPADGTYGGDCDSSGLNCRAITVAITASTTLKAGASCVEAPAVLQQSDGKPVNAGQKLIANWDTGSLEATISVSKGFK